MMKMKHYIHNLWRMAFCLLAVLMTAACSDGLDTPDTPSTTLPGVKPGSVVLSLAGMPATRNASAEIEEKVERLDVLIFKQSEDVTDDNDLQCVYHRRFRRSVGTGTDVAEDLFTADGTDGYTYYAVLGRVADFVEGATYYVYVLGNTHADKPEKAETVTQTDMQKKLDDLFPLSDRTDGQGCSHDTPQGSLDKLKNFVYTTANIHLSGDESNRPNVFVMDGMACLLKDESDNTDLTLNNGDLFAVRNLYATLLRAAAKVTVILTADPSEKHTVMLPERLWIPNQMALGNDEVQQAGQASYEWHNVNQREDTYLVTPDNYGIVGNESNDFPAATKQLKSPAPTKYNIEVTSGLEGNFKATTYSYSHYWNNTASTYEDASYLTVRVPVIYCADGIPESFDYMNREWTADEVGEGESTSHYTTTVTVTAEDGTQTDRTIHYYVANYYKIPMGKDGRMDRNTHYYVTGNLTRPGSTTADKPMEITNVRFQVVPWIPEHIDAGGESNVHYLMVNKNEYTIRNVNSDNTLIYSSSHPVTVTLKRVWYVDKKGENVELMNADGTFVTSVQVENNNGDEVTKTYTGDEIPSVSVSWDNAKLNDNIVLRSNNPVNNLVRHIELEVTNTKDDHETVIIHQYPLDYIQFTEGVYSYWDDNYQFSTMQYSKELYYVAVDKASNDQRGTWIGKTDNTQSYVFHPKYKDSNNNLIYSYYYNKTQLKQGFRRNGWKDYRIYHIQLTSTSPEYVLAHPKVEAMDLPEFGWVTGTAFGDDNANRVSPSFMINSQLGATSNDVAQNDNNDTDQQKKERLVWAHTFAAHYAEVYRDREGNLRVYDDWRLPTPAEIKIIMKFQGLDSDPSESMFVVMNGHGYWTSNGHVTNENFPKPLASDNCIRLVRDVYDLNNVDKEGRLVKEVFGDQGYTSVDMNAIIK